MYPLMMVPIGNPINPITANTPAICFTLSRSALNPLAIQKYRVPIPMNKMGTIVRLKTVMLGNPVGAVGVVFNEYKDFDDPAHTGVQVIFQNGRYDGFSHFEQTAFLEDTNVKYQKGENYIFTSVMQVDMDYKHGYWDFALIRRSLERLKPTDTGDSSKVSL